MYPLQLLDNELLIEATGKTLRAQKKHSERKHEPVCLSWVAKQGCTESSSPLPTPEDIVQTDVSTTLFIATTRGWYYFLSMVADPTPPAGGLTWRPKLLQRETESSEPSAGSFRVHALASS